MTQLDMIKRKVTDLFHTHPNIRMDVRMIHPKIELKNDPVTIKGVYKNVFRIEEYSSGVPKCHTLQYTDILTGQFRIIE